jgi:ABC-type siderophore export system fused ATPase/permease subunit
MHSMKVAKIYKSTHTVQEYAEFLQGHIKALRCSNEPTIKSYPEFYYHMNRLKCDLHRARREIQRIRTIQRNSAYNNANLQR